MGFYIQNDYWEALEDQSATVRNVVLGALTELYFTGECSQKLKGTSKALFTAFRDRVLIARNKSNSQPKRKQIKTKTEPKRNQNGTKLKPKQNQNKTSSIKEGEEEREKDKPPKPLARFIPPSVDDLSKFAIEQGFSDFNADRFVDYYAAQGWKLSNGNPMKDWKAAARNWHRRGDHNGNFDLSAFDEYV